jgi:hypothetical protein
MGAAYEILMGQALPSPDPASGAPPASIIPECFGDGFTLGTSAYGYPNDTEGGSDLIRLGQKPIMAEDGLPNDTPIPAALLDEITALGVYPAYLFTQWPFTRTVCPLKSEPCRPLDD